MLARKIDARTWLTCGCMAHKGLEVDTQCARKMKAEDSGSGGRKDFSLLSSLRIRGAGFNWMDTIAWYLIN